VPELPEVETIKKALEQNLLDQTLSAVEVLNPKLRFKVPTKELKALVDHKIISIRRRSKYLLLDFSNALTLIIHLGMTGRLLLDGKSYKHDHVILTFKSGQRLTYNDVRKFGLIDICQSGDLDNHKLIKNLGIEPLESKFTKANLKEIFSNKSKSIKLAIMDANLVVGVGNIYASESLFESKISPLRQASSLKEFEIENLRKAIIKTLKAALKAGGSTLKDFKHLSGDSGYFQHSFLVYDREGQACKNCKKAIIRIKQQGRSTFYCTNCQK
jgi:formamidopyrimidine-DNA glycosylase